MDYSKRIADLEAAVFTTNDTFMAFKKFLHSLYRKFTVHTNITIEAPPPFSEYAIRVRANVADGDLILTPLKHGQIMPLEWTTLGMIHVDNNNFDEILSSMLSEFELDKTPPRSSFNSFLDTPRIHRTLSSDASDYTFSFTPAPPQPKIPNPFAGSRPAFGRASPFGQAPAFKQNTATTPTFGLPVKKHVKNNGL